MSSTLPRLPVFEAIAGHEPGSKCVVHSHSGRTFRYGQLLVDVSKARDHITGAAGQKSLDGERIAFLVENSYDYIGEPPQS
jgi:malonyl-CoA/methylmalonyl-CoA synthetase